MVANMVKAMGQLSFVCNLIWDSRTPPYLCFCAGGIYVYDLFVPPVSEGRKKEGRDASFSFACVLVFKVMYFYICWFVCVGGQVWVSVYLLLVQCQREVQVGTLPGPAHILRPRGSVRQLHTSIRENPQLRAPLEQVCELMATSGDCPIVTSAWHLVCLQRV